MAIAEIKNGIYWVGALDKGVRNFHGHTYNTKRGTTYNAYLILDDKIALVDTVYKPFSEELIKNISQIIPVNKIDYIIANHVEDDHSGALPQIAKLAPGAKIFGTAKCKDGLYRHYYEDWDFNIVKTNDKLKLGKRSICFIEAPMVHWPDSMFSYIPEERLLLPNDAFGQHYATEERFDDEVPEDILMEEASKYYANILWPLGSVILKKLQEVQNLKIDIDMIAPSHGIIWRRNPEKIIDAYLGWAKNELRPKVTIVFETMWGATQKMAEEIAAGIKNCGLEARLFNISESDRTEIIDDMLTSRGFIIGSSTHDNGMLPNIAGFLEFLKGLTPKNRIAAAFGSFGWAGGAVKSIEDKIKGIGIELAQDGLAVRYQPSKEDIQSCQEFAKAFAKKV